MSDAIYSIISPHWIIVPLGRNDRIMGVYSGIVRVEKKSLSETGWDNEKITFRVDLHLSNDKVLQLEQWAPHVTLNALSNDGHAMNLGAAVDSFGIVVPKFTVRHLEIEAWIAVRDIDGWFD